jgi:hypothetical protein
MRIMAMQTSVSHVLPHHRPALVGSAVGLAFLAVLALAVGAGAGRDAFVAGQSGTRSVALGTVERTRALDRSAAVRRALGLPDGARQSVSRLEDRFEGGVVDEITTLDAADRPVALVRLETSGRLRTAVRLGWSSATGDLNATAARRHAERLVRSAGLSMAREPSLVGRTGHGWAVAWPRLAGGVAVRGDGTTVRLWPDGSLHSLSDVESPLASGPSQPIDRGAATSLVRSALAGWGLTDAMLGEPVLSWVAPNDLFEPARPDAPDPVRRLAWVVRVTPMGEVASRLRAIEVHIDAGDGRLLGGDVLE